MLLLSLLITPSSANCSNTARADIHARGFWGRQQGALFDVRVFRPNAPSYCQNQVASLFHRHELKKNREYGECIHSMDCESFTHLIFLILVVWARRLTFFTTIWQIFYHRNTIHLTTTYFPGCIVLCHFHYYVPLYWPFMGVQSTELPAVSTALRLVESVD